MYDSQLEFKDIINNPVIANMYRSEVSDPGCVAMLLHCIPYHCLQ